MHCEARPRGDSLGSFRELVDWVAACDGELVMDVYYKAENWEKELVGWKVNSLSSCG